MPTYSTQKFTSAKARIAAIGATLTAATTALAAVQVALADDTLDTGEISSVILAAVVLVSTVYGVWRVPNEVKSAGTREGGSQGTEHKFH